ncbi:MAG: flagellar basal body P-ring formation protein FlgA [Alphaproteobacteria bacterium]|nr:flagellar basal body P-ring formation protein FlgA [Alphaproteobacteria bacterium]
MFVRMMMFAALACALSATSAFADAPVTLRPHIEAQGGAVTLGDVFEGAGEAAGRAVAPAPAPGRQAQLSAPFLAAAADAAGLSWTPPDGVETVIVHGRALRVHPLAARSDDQGATADAAVRRGEMVTLVYVAPGMQLTTRARAMQNGAIGDVIRVTNLQSNTAVDATVTGPGAASASAR